MKRLHVVLLAACVFVLCALPALAQMPPVLINGNNSGTIRPVAVDSTGATVLGTGAAAIGKLAANSGVIIGDVNVVSEIPGTGATNLGKAEDAAHASADTGVMMLGVRNEAASQISGADADYTPIAVDAYGALYSRPDHPKRFACNNGLNNAATILTVLSSQCAAPGAGLSLYITDISASASVISSTTADNYLELKVGTGGACGTGTAVVWGAYSLAFSPVHASFNMPLKLPANNELCWMHAAAGSKTFVVTGFIAP